MGVLILKIYDLNHVLIGKRPGMGRMIGPKSWDRSVEFLETFWAVRDSPETGWAVCVGN